MFVSVQANSGLTPLQVLKLHALLLLLAKDKGERVVGSIVWARERLPSHVRQSLSSGGSAAFRSARDGAIDLLGDVPTYGGREYVTERLGPIFDGDGAKLYTAGVHKAINDKVREPLNSGFAPCSHAYYCDQVRLCQCNAFRSVAST